jgi:NDP-sugar pyrophosphorylase family protein
MVEGDLSRHPLGTEPHRTQNQGGTQRMTYDTTAMILAAGLGTRLQALTKDRPKALVELNGKPLLQHCIEDLIANGFHHIVINVHHFGEQIIDFVEHHRFDAEIQISDECDLLMDTGGGIIKATPLFKDSKAVLVHNVDIISDVNFYELSQQFLVSGDDAWLLTQDRETNRKLLFNTDNQLVGWTNKVEQQFKWVDESKSALRRAQGPSLYYKEMAFGGLHFFRSDLFAEFEEKRLSVIDLYLNLAKNNRIISKPIQPDYWFDLGKPEQLQAAENYLNNLVK